jgi:hypothetical protein
LIGNEADKDQGSPRGLRARVLRRPERAAPQVRTRGALSGRPVL